jgi:hypothetical protein
MPGDGGYWSRQQSEATRKAQEAAEAAAAAAAAKKAAAQSAPTALTPEQRQANIARDQALSQIRGARPSGQDSQFYQPAYQPQYQNYSNPLTAFNVSNYGTNPAMSRSMRDATAPGAGGVDPYYKQLQSYASLFGTQPDNNNINFNTLLKDMQRYGISAQDLQNASSYSPFSYQQPMQQRQAPFNPYTNQYQTPFSYQQPMQQQMQTPFSNAGQRLQQQVNYYSQGNQPSLTQPMSIEYPQQMQTPFSYQQPMAQPAVQPNYGPSQAIVGRSSQMRGTPNVMRRAEGGIASLFKKNK